jgi:NADH-quinone oxidoreductase subunit C
VPEIDTNSLENKYQQLFSTFRDEIISTENFRGDLCVCMRPTRVREIVKFIKSDPSMKFEVLMDLFGMDYLKFGPETPERFAVIYLFYSLTRHEHLRIKVYLSEDNPVVDSIHDLYAAANWHEREVWDLFGVTFSGHPNLLRILCHNDFVGHPLRKDYPSDRYQRLKNAATSSGF